MVYYKLRLQISVTTQLYVLQVVSRRLVKQMVDKEKALKQTIGCLQLFASMKTAATIVAHSWNGELSLRIRKIVTRSHRRIKNTFVDSFILFYLIIIKFRQH